MRTTICAALAAASFIVPAAARDRDDPAAAKAAKVRGFSIGLTGYATLPLAKPSELGAPRPYREKDVVFSMPLAWEDRTAAEAEIKVPVAGFDWTIKQGDMLTRARIAEGGNLDTLPKGAVTYCGESFKKKGGIAAHLLTLGLSSIGSRLSNWLQLCVVDSDVDGKFDQGFLVGTKKAPDRVLVPITPVAYTPRKLEPIPDGRFDVVYYDGGAFTGPNFELHLFGPGGTRQALSVVGFPNNAAPDDVLKDKAARAKWEAETPSSLNWFFTVKSKQIPQAFTVGDARFTVQAIDKVNKTATISLDRDPQGFPISTWLQPQITYIYVYIPR